jgi:hypothetical protein
MACEPSIACTLRPHAGKTILLLLLSAAFTATGIAMMASGKIFTAWLVTGFFGLCSAVFVVMLLPGASCLRLQPDGFIVRSLFRQWPLTRWEDVSEFATARVSLTHTMVVYGEAKPHNARLASANKALFRFTSGLPDTYGMKPGELAALLNRWRAAALERAGKS